MLKQNFGRKLFHDITFLAAIVPNGARVFEKDLIRLRLQHDLFKEFDRLCIQAFTTHHSTQDVSFFCSTFRLHICKIFDVKKKFREQNEQQCLKELRRKKIQL